MRSVRPSVVLHTAAPQLSTGMALAAQSISSIVSEVKVAHALYDSEARRRNMLSVVAAANEQTSLAYDQIDRLRSDISRAIDDIHRHLETSACPPAHR